MVQAVLLYSRFENLVIAYHGLHGISRVIPDWKFYQCVWDWIKRSFMKFNIWVWIFGVLCRWALSKLVLISYQIFVHCFILHWTVYYGKRNNVMYDATHVMLLYLLSIAQFDSFMILQKYLIWQVKILFKSEIIPFIIMIYISLSKMLDRSFEIGCLTILRLFLSEGLLYDPFINHL